MINFAEQKDIYPAVALFVNYLIIKTDIVNRIFHILKYKE